MPLALVLFSSPSEFALPSEAVGVWGLSQAALVEGRAGWVPAGG